jgi:hypothetical protein
MSKPGALDQLPLVHELNRAFLGLLQSRLIGGRACLGLPRSAHVPVAAAKAAVLEGVSAFPRALFRLRLGQNSGPPLCPDAEAYFDEAEHDLCLWSLLAARQTSRQSAYQARLLFDLAPVEVERLRAAPLTDMQQLACAPGVLQCAFPERPWFWPQLFTATRPELRRQLTLMALQPCSAMVWPQRRPPHSTA